MGSEMEWQQSHFATKREQSATEGMKPIDQNSVAIGQLEAKVIYAVALHYPTTKVYKENFYKKKYNSTNYGYYCYFTKRKNTCLRQWVSTTNLRRVYVWIATMWIHWRNYGSTGNHGGILL